MKYHTDKEKKAARENLPAPKTRGEEVSNKNDITGKEEPQKKTVDKTAKIGKILSINFLIYQLTNYLGTDNFPRTSYFSKSFFTNPFSILFFIKLFI